MSRAPVNLPSTPARRRARHVLTMAIVAQLCGCGSLRGSPNDGSGGGTGTQDGGPATGGASASGGGTSLGSGGRGGGASSSGGQSATGGAPGTGGMAPGTGGVTPGSGGSTESGGAIGSGGAGGRGDGGASSSGGAGGIGAGGGTSAGVAVFNPDRAILTAVRGVTTPHATEVVHIVNQGKTPAILQSVALGGVNASAFTMTMPQLPTTLAPGADASVTLELLTSGAGIPAAPAQDSGASLLTATLTATLDGGAIQSSVYGLLLTQALWEPTLGQILTTLGYKLNVGLAQNNSNPNRNKTVQQLPGVEAGTDEIAAPLFVKAGAGNVTLVPVARFSPMGPLPLGWYPAGNTGMRNVVATMSKVTDAQTSNKARMVNPPLDAGSMTGFDPGTQKFGIWIYTDQLSMKYDTGTVAYGDYDYSEDGPNSPANVHRMKVYPLKDSTGTAITNSFLIAIEEAANGDYQDYVFVLGNAKVAP